jgi:hypothetical protein
MSTPTSVQIVPGNLVLSGNVDTNDTDNTFCIDRANGIVGIGRGLTSLVTDGDDPHVLQISGEVSATKFHGDGSQLTGLTFSKWEGDIDNVNNIYYSLGNVGIGGVASTEKLTIYGDLNIKNSGQLKFDGADAVFSKWSSDTNGIYRPSNVGIGGVPSATNKLKVHGTVEATALSVGGTDISSTYATQTALTGKQDVAPSGETYAHVSQLPDTSSFIAASALTTLNLGLSSHTGTLATARIPNLNTSKITSGTLGSGRIPSLDASKITGGTFDRDRIPTTLRKTSFSSSNHTTWGSVGGWYMYRGFSSSGSAIHGLPFTQYDGDSDFTKSVGVVAGAVLTGNMWIYSDKRNKKNIKTIDTTTALYLIDKVNPVSYIDKMSNRKKSGVIAQEIKEFIPHCVSTDIEPVCDIMIPCTFISKEIHDNTPEVSINKFKLNKPLSSDIELVPDQTFVQLEKTTTNGTDGVSDILDTFLYFKHDEEYIYLLSIIAEATFELNDDDVCMLTGRVVNDALSVDYHSLFSVGLSAIKELNIQRVKDKKRIDDLEDTVANLLERINSLEGS